MSSIDIRELENIRKQLDSLEEDDVLFIDEDGETRFVVMPAAQYDFIDEMLKQSQNLSMPRVRVINGNELELSYDEYEAVKKQLNDIIEKTFKPKPEKLN
ncbi:MAG: hypothetical protein IJJ00_08035 [Erysipelotrichaceae bacterium]|nr:hypothetical protein [Erysipelotrichaceae bacterium]